MKLERIEENIETEACDEGWSAITDGGQKMYEGAVTYESQRILPPNRCRSICCLFNLEDID